MKKHILFFKLAFILTMLFMGSETFAAYISSGIYIEDTAITSDDQVADGADVALLGVGSITLEPGFHAEEGCVFKAIIRDGDSLSDLWEMQNFGNLDQNPDDDPDGDELTNLEEETLDVDPNVFDNDTDDDGLKDRWELDYFSDLDEEAQGDTDSDGITNIIEYTLGTEPDLNTDKPAPGIYYEYDAVGRIKSIVRIK